MEYSTEVLARVRTLTRVGALSADAADVGTGEMGTLESGTVTRIQVRVTGERVVEARFRVFGCSAAIASASLTAEWLEGASIEGGRTLTAARIAETLRLPAERAHVAQMAVDAAQSAIGDWERKCEVARQKSEEEKIEEEGTSHKPQASSLEPVATRQ